MHGFSVSVKMIILGCCAVLLCAGSAFAQGWTDTCKHLRVWAAVNPSDEVVAQKQYDTLRQYIERCAVSDSNSWDVFVTLDGADQFRSADTNRYYQYRAWLISVLYLNTRQPEYFCACVGSLMSTYQKTVEVLALLNYLRTYHRECWGAGGDKEYTQDSTTAAHSGHDPTHLPSLDSLGLGFLLKSDVTPSSSGSKASFLASFTSSPNPFIKETTLEFTLNRMAYVQLAIYDELGRLVWGDGMGSSLEAGTHDVRIDAAKFPSGTLYARISTGFGEVKTVKLIHE